MITSGGGSLHPVAPATSHDPPADSPFRALEAGPSFGQEDDFDGKAVHKSELTGCGTRRMNFAPVFEDGLRTNAEDALSSVRTLRQVICGPRPADYCGRVCAPGRSTMTERQAARVAPGEISWLCVHRTGR